MTATEDKVMDRRCLLRVGEIADKLGVSPHQISNLLYTRSLGRDFHLQTKIFGGARRVPEELLGEIRRECKRRGWID